MKRIHALEWEDLSWFPKSWRDYGTDYLQFFATRFDVYKSILPLIRKGLDKSGKNEWVDCASGGGGGLINLAKTLKSERPDLKITLTDFYPNHKAFEKTRNLVPDVFEIESNPVDARQVPSHLQGKFMTLFGAFHHFRPYDAERILQSAIDSNSNIAIFEPVARNFASCFSMIFVPLNVLILTPFIRPVRWNTLIFIYLIPIIPLYILWDGIASILRTYSKEERKELVSRLRNSDSYEWEIGETEGPMPVNYLVGYFGKELGNRS